MSCGYVSNEAEYNKNTDSHQPSHRKNSCNHPKHTANEYFSQWTLESSTLQ